MENNGCGLITQLLSGVEHDLAIPFFMELLFSDLKPFQGGSNFRISR